MVSVVDRTGSVVNKNQTGQRLLTAHIGTPGPHTNTNASMCDCGLNSGSPYKAERQQQQQMLSDETPEASVSEGLNLWGKL